MDDDFDENDDELDDTPNYYAVLNVRKEANDEEIKVAYRTMCVRYHSDKHIDPKNKETAEIIFAKVHKAYEVLSDSQKRMIYDIYGQKGLDAGWEVIERRRSPAEIRQEYERLQREAEERRIEQKTNPKGSISLQIDATDMFSTDDGEYEDEYGGGGSSWSLPTIDIKGMSINQSIEAPLTRHNTAILSGKLQHTKDSGSGNVNCALRRVFSHQSWGELEFATGTTGGEFSVKGFRNLDKKRFGTLSLTSSIKQSRLSAGLQAMVASQLTKNTMGYLSGMCDLAGMLRTGKTPSSVTSTIVTNTDRYNLMAQLQLGIPRSFGMVSYTHKFGDNDDTKLKTVLKYGALGFVLEYSFEHKVTSLSNVQATVSAGQLSGVTLRLKIHRHTQTFDFPIFLSEVVTPSALFYGTIAPIIAFFTVKALIIVPMLRQQKEKDIEESREKNALVVAEKQREAESAINLMLDTYRQIVKTEQDKDGLIILEAWYGKFISKHRETEKSNVINVTIPMQCLVKDSKLILGDTVKSQLTGIYDPCIGEEKLMKIVYEFHGLVHEAIFKDEEQVRCPKQSHKISTKIS